MASDNQDQVEGYVNSLHEFVQGWIVDRNTTWDWLMTQAGLPKSTGTTIRKGSEPRPATLRKLAAAMGVTRRRMFEVAGYVLPHELEPQLFDISDPEIRMFLEDGEWIKYTPQEQEFVRDAVRYVRKHRFLREELDRLGEAMSSPERALSKLY